MYPDVAQSAKLLIAIKLWLAVGRFAGRVRGRPRLRLLSPHSRKVYDVVVMANRALARHATFGFAFGERLTLATMWAWYFNWEAFIHFVSSPFMCRISRLCIQPVG